MVLSDVEIRHLVKENEKLISPFDESKLSAASYDVSIGSAVYEIAAAPNIIMLNDQSSIDGRYIKTDISEGFILKPGQYVLCPLAEHISLPDNMIARVMPRTRYTRMGLLLAPQYCNPSYSGTLSLGLSNASPNNVVLVPGLSIGQLIFERLEQQPSEAKLYRNQPDSFYQDESDFIGAKFGSELSDEADKVYKAMLDRLSGKN
ncbi:dCTP deaminase [Bifidobacterium vansinderenii]|uniref:Deoxycytidine deaminase n=1 Tax=Bifidobacterium vansinderenii TaxID=1984871 RepID=A0A229VUL6_9BIFI|nr:dCTP deaminase [Bifidobacterium vansinderenii]OXM99322.1 Deoxycytidine deaminase [Bifidobacterium vansinderenii]